MEKQGRNDNGLTTDLCLAFLERNENIYKVLADSEGNVYSYFDHWKYYQC